MEGRLALGTVHVTLDFDGGDGDREQIAHLYRVGRILRHVSADGHVSIEAEVPAPRARSLPVGRGTRVMTSGCRRAAARRRRDLPCSAWAACAAKKTPDLPPAPGVGEVSGFRVPGRSRAPGAAGLAARHQVAWQWLQAGDLRAAERNFNATLKEAPAFYPSEAGLGYVALAKNDNKAAASHFDRALAANPAYAPALVGRGEALLKLGEREPALRSFEAAVAADPQLSALRERIAVLRFRGLQNDVDAARKAADAGRLAEAHALYARTIAASPDSPFLYRELAVVERREGNLAAALEHAQKAAQLNPSEPRNFVTIAEIHEALGDYAKAADAYGAAAAIEPSESIDAKIDELRERAAFAAMPAEYKSIEASPTVTRGPAGRAPRRAARRRAPARAPRQRRRADRHARQLGRAVDPVGLARRPDGGVSRITRSSRTRSCAAGISPRRSPARWQLIAAGNPRLAGSWRNARGRFSDLPPGHLSYPRPSVAVESGVMPALERRLLPAVAARSRGPKRWRPSRSSKSSPGASRDEPHRRGESAHAAADAADSAVRDSPPVRVPRLGADDVPGRRR